MANIDVKQIRIAKRYSEALIDNTDNKQEAQDIHNQLIFINQTLISSADLKAFLENPIISQQDKTDVINQIFSRNISEKVKNLLFLLIDNNRFDAFAAIVSEYEARLDELNNVIKARVISAIELNEDAKGRLIQKLESKTSKTVVADYQINPQIIAGIIVEINDKTIDTSLKTKLNNIKKQLI